MSDEKAVANVNTNNTTKKKNYYANMFCSFSFFLSLLFFMGGFFIGTKSMNFVALMYAVKQVLIPAFIMGYLGLLIGRFLDRAKVKRKKYMKK